VTRPDTVDPDSGDVIVTTRVPTLWARAGACAIPTKQAIIDRAAARASLIWAPTALIRDL
jgi:hypothetical protein